MEIKILQNPEWKSGTYLTDNYVLETTEYDSEFEDIKRVEYSLLDISNNEKTDILPNIEKYNIGDIVNVSLDSKYIYFTNIFKEDEGRIVIIRYNVETKETESLYSYNDNLNGLNQIRRIKLFIINDLYIIIQNEYLVSNISQTYSDFFKFDQRLYNLKDNTEYDITDENFNNNGISYIIPISENQCVIKTGFSLLKDNRYNMLEKKECSLESVSFVNISQMISDLVITDNAITLDTIDQAFYTTTIPYIKKEGNYLIYSCVNNATKEEEVKFYNLSNNEVRSCINQDVIRFSDLAKAYVINSEPYICIDKDKEYSFLNINTKKIDRKYSKGTRMCEILDNVIIFSGIKKSIFSNKSKAFFDIITFPQTKLLLHEQKEYIDCLITKDDVIYIIVK